MELLVAALVLGLIGSLHCAAMCGPLLLAVTNTGGARARWRKSPLVYHAGRLTTYCAIGMLFGAVGKTFALVGLQRWLSITAGGFILVAFVVSSRGIATRTIARAVTKVKTVFSRLLLRRSIAAQFLLGMLNGLLPCGLVYVAAAGAAATLSPWLGAAYMAVFGLGTLPMLLGIGVVGSHLNASWRFRRLIPVSVTMVGLLLLIRGMALGIPYLSPALQSGVACH